MQGAADLGRDLELVTRFGAEKPAEPVLRKSAAVPGSGIIVADAEAPGRIQRSPRIRLIDLPIELADMRAAEAESRQRQAGLANRAASFEERRQG
jgi:hypothetical protein